MIRFHEEGRSNGTRFRVSARRVPRGRIYWDKQAREIRENGVGFASVTWQLVEGWRALGFNGFRSKTLYGTKLEAAVAICTDHRYEATWKPLW